MNKRSDYYEEVSKDDPRCLLERGFSADCRNVMEITASYLGGASNNNELLRTQERQLQRMRTIAEVGRVISSEKNPDEILEETLRPMVEALKPEICLLFVKDNSGKVVLKQSHGMPMIDGAHYYLREGVTGAVAATGKPILIDVAGENDGKYDPQILAYLAQQHGPDATIESLMVVPIIAKDQILGVMKVINTTEDHRRYADSDMEYFATFGRYVGMAIENAKIYRVASDELAIAKRNAALAVLVSSVAHEINNTSGGIPANVEGIRAELQTPSDAVESMLSLIEDLSNQATEFANEIAGFSVTRRGDKEPLDINQVIKRAIKELKPNLDKYPGRLKLALNDDSLICMVYTNPFKQIVRNVVINAFQAIGEKKNGVVRISTGRSATPGDRFAFVEIADNGPGIKDEHLKDIFKPEFTTKPKGNGIGLWLVQTQLEQVGGTIGVDSKLGRGAKFTLKIPILMEVKQPDGRRKARSAR